MSVSQLPGLASTRRSLSGRTSVYALGDDPRFSYCLYLPRTSGQSPSRPVLVTVHGTERDTVGIRDAFVPFAELHGLAILSPLFPAGIDDPDDVDNYKFIRFRGLRFDDILIQMLKAAEERIGATLGPTHLVGFSGGAQFVHRFMYFHPALVASVSIAAPGRITLLDSTRDWWAGTRDVEQVLGERLNLAAIRDVRAQVVVGSADIGPGVTPRVDQARALDNNYRDSGLSSRLDVVPGASHELTSLIPTITDFIGGQIRSTGRCVS